MLIKLYLMPYVCKNTYFKALKVCRNTYFKALKEE